VYRPGATKAQTWYSTQGSAMPVATSTVTLIGIRNGETTPTAIMCAPAGSDAISGRAR
jgi:hypothetical protein